MFELLGRAFVFAAQGELRLLIDVPADCSFLAGAAQHNKDGAWGFI